MYPDYLTVTDTHSLEGWNPRMRIITKPMLVPPLSCAGLNVRKLTVVACYFSQDAQLTA